MASGLLIAAFIGQTALPFVPASVPFDNALAKVELSATAPGKPGKPHDHPTSRVLIYFEPGTNTVAFADGHVVKEAFDVGTVLWNNAMGTHVATIGGAGPVDLVHVDIKSPPAMVPQLGYALRDPLTVAPEKYRLEIDNNQVRVLRLTLKPGEKTPSADDVFERLLVPITPGHLRVTDGQGHASEVSYKQAELKWLPPGIEADKNIGDKPYEAVIVEFKK